MSADPQITDKQTPRPSAASRFDAAFCAERARIRVLYAAILASALGFIDGSIVSIAMPAMRDSLAATLTQAQWINNAYMLPLSALILAGGALGDRFGLGRVFSIGIAIFIVASLISAAAPTADILIAARALKGIGAALMVPGSMALIYRAYPPDDRGRALGIWAAASALTTALGPILGGLIITAAGPETWRWLFAVNLPLGLIAIWLIKGAVNEDRSSDCASVDWQGAVLVTLSLGLMAWALTGSGQAGIDMRLIGLFSLVSLALFLLWEIRAANPMLPLRLFANRTFSAANIATFCLYFALSGILFFLPMTVITAWGVTEAAASTAFVPLTATIALLSTRMGRLADTHGPGLLIGTGAAIVALAYAGLALTAPLQSFWGAVLPLMCLMGLGMSLVVAPLSAAVMGAVDDREAGAASGINNAVSRIAGLVAIALMGGVAASAYASAGGPGSFGAPSDAAAHTDATNHAFATIAWITAAMSAASSLVAFVGLGRRQIG
ncbi:MAG: MFS transporter [Pseudomonadota bacterium]